MANDYIPRSDTDFRVWLTNFNTYGVANVANLGLVAADFTPVTTAMTLFNTALDAHIAAQAAAESARAAKDSARAAVEAQVRPLVRRIQAMSPFTVTDAERLALGITVRDATSSPAPIPTTRPVAVIDARERLRHTIRFSDEATPTRKAKPAGAMGVEVWVKVVAAGGAAPASESELSFLALDTNSPYVAEYEGSDGGKTAHYWLRWVNTRGEKGPWSENANATIGG